MAKEKSKLPRMALVEWDDAWSDTKRVSVKDTAHYERSYPMYSCGFLKTSDKSHVVICRDYEPGIDLDDEETVSRGQRIPRAIVKSIRYLKTED